MGLRRMAWFAPGLAALACAPAAQRDLVGLNTLEYAYISFANNLAASGPRDSYYPGPDVVPAAVSICEKISPQATELSASWGGFEGWSFSYAQAQCFFNVAASAKAIEVCDRMREMDAPPPKWTLSKKRERRLTRDECRAEASRDGGRGGEFGTDVMLALLGYSEKDRTAAGGGRPIEEFGAYEFKSHLLYSHRDGDDFSTKEDLLRRVARLPDFSKGDDAARRQIDAPVPGWARADNQDRIASLLRCYVQRLDVGEAMSARCD